VDIENTRRPAVYTCTYSSGSFNGWQPQPLTEGPGGFSTTIDLPSGTYQYKFVIDGRRWCFDIMKPHATDERGNRNNEVRVGDRGGDRGRKVERTVENKNEPTEDGKQQQQQQGKRGKQQQQQQQQQQQGKGGKQQQQQQQKKGQKQQKQEKQEKQEKEEEPQEEKKVKGVVAQGQAQKIIGAIKTYQSPFYVGDVDHCEDDLEEILETAEIFRRELPTNGCMFVSGGTKSFIVVAVVPQEKTAEITALEWVDAALSIIPDAKAEGNDTLAHGVVMASPEKNIYPLKLKDTCRGPSFALLRKKKLIREEESSDEMYFFDE